MQKPSKFITNTLNVFKMKKLLITLFITTGFALSINAQKSIFDEKYLSEGTYIFDDILRIEKEEIFTKYKEEFGLSKADEMKEEHTEILETGLFHTKYVQIHNGYPVEGALMNVMGDKGIVLRANGFVLKDLKVESADLITEEKALYSALSFIKADRYAWEDEEWEKSVKMDTKNEEATNYPKGELMIAKKRGEEYPHTSDYYRLCYKFKIQSIKPANLIDVYVDASSGEIYTTQNTIVEDFNKTGSQWTWYNGQRTDIVTRTCGLCSNYWLTETGQGREVDTRNEGSSDKIKDNNNNWVENDTKTAASAHWALQRSFDYFLNRHGRWGTNYNGRSIKINTNSSTIAGLSNAAHSLINGVDHIFVRANNTAVAMPSAGVAGLGFSAAMLDVMAHEYTHGMVAASSQLGILGDFQARSLNEAFADIFGLMVERNVNGTTDWTFAENMGTYQRNFQDPHTDFGMFFTNNGSNSGASASRLNEPGFWSTTNAHANGGVMRRWFHLLSQGGTLGGETVTGLGIEQTDDIAYITFNWWLWSNITYQEAAQQSVAATVFHYGQCSNQHRQTVRAYRAVGFNIPVPPCPGIIISGSNALAINSNNTVFSADLAENQEINGKFEWKYPSKWHVRQEGNKLKVLDFGGDDSSSELSVTYTTPSRSTLNDKMTVHFSNKSWKPTINKYKEFVKEQDRLQAAQIKEDVAIYPNPTSNEVNVVLPKNVNFGTLYLSDLSGRELLKLEIEDNAKTIDVSQFNSGLYIITVKAGDKIFNQKLSIIK